MAVNDDDTKQGPLDARIARLYREGALEEPPAHLDRSIAAAARDAGRIAAAERQPSPPRRGVGGGSGGGGGANRWTPWRVPFAFAAVAIVSVSLVTLVIEERGSRFTDVPRQAPAATGRDAARSEIERKAGLEVPPAAVPSPRPESGGGGAVRERAKVAGGEPPPDPFPAGRRDEPGAEARPAAPEASPRALHKPGPAESAAASAPAADAGLAAAPQVRAETEANAVEARPRSAPAAAPMSAPPPMRSEPARAAAPAPAQKATAPPGAAPGVLGRAEESGSLRAQTQVAAHIRELEKQPFPAWLERVLALRREGRRIEADALLAELRRRYPNEPLPAELQ